MKTRGIVVRLGITVLFLFFLFIVSLTVTAPTGAAEKSEETTIAQQEGTSSSSAADKGSETAVTEETATEDTGAVAAEEASSAKDKDKDKDAKEKDKADKEKEKEDKAGSTEMTLMSTMAAGGAEGGGISTPSADNVVFTGAAQVQIPIIVPPGRGGIAPQLALRYNSYLGNSWLGLGWELSMGAIQRSNKQGVDYTANAYCFVKDGMSRELVARPEWGANYYGAKVEEEFTLFYLNPITGGWEAMAKDGTRYFYGTTVASRQDNTLGAFGWALDRVEDPNGNYLTVTYTKDQGELYLNRINCTGNNAGLSPTNYVKFYLEDRPDAAVMYTTNAAVKTAKRLKTIEVVGNGSRARAYKLTYTQHEGTVRSLLATVLQVGADAVLDSSGTVAGGTTLRTITMDTSLMNNTFADPANWRDYTAINSWDQFWVADFTGDGKEDLMYLSTAPNKYMVMASTGTGFADPVNWHSYTNHNSWTQFWIADFNGDGKKDIMYLSQSPYKYMVMLSTGTGFADPISWHTYINVNAWTQFWIADFNSDGKKDIMYLSQSPNKYMVMLSTGTGFSDPVAWKDYIAVNSWDQFWIADVTGDGKDDIMYVSTSPNKYMVMQSTGTGFADAGAWKDYTAPYSATHQWVDDFNGDGKKDIMYLSKSPYEYMVMLSTGTSFADPVAWHVYDASTTPFGAEGFIIKDFNGDDKADILYVSTTPHKYLVMLSRGDGFDDAAVWHDYLEWEQGAAWFGDFNGDNATDILYFSSSKYMVMENNSTPALLVSLANGLGATTTLEYTPSTAYQNTYLPYVLYPVSKITVNDGVTTPAVTTYSYQGGYYDQAEQDFCGFAQVTRTNPDGTTVKTWFHQDQYRKRRPYQVEFREPQTNQTNEPALLTKETLAWELYPTTPAADTAAFVKLTQDHTEYYDTATVYTQQDYYYDDANGNLMATVASGTDAEAVTKENTYQDLGTWLWRLTKETVSGATSGRVREISYGYDNRGNMTSVTRWLDGGASPLTTMAYDIYGNCIAVTDPKGNTTATTYETVAHTYPTTVTAPQTSDGINHIVQYEEYDYRFGKVTRLRDENNNRTYYAYDPFGRLIQTDLPDGGRVTATYYDHIFPRYIITKVKESATSTTDTYAYVDGLNRSIQQISFGEGGTSIVTKTHYDTMGRVDLTEGPFFGAGIGYPQQPPAAYAWVQTAYDFRGRPLQVTHPDSTYGDVTTAYAYSGFATTSTDPDGSARTGWRDHLGRIIQVTEHAEGGAYYNTQYTYNAAGDLLQVLDHAGNAFIMAYDTLGRKIAMEDPDMGYWEYAYDANGNLISETNERALMASAPEATEIHTTYDAMDRVISETKKIEGNPTQYLTRMQYDLAGRPLKTIYPDNYEVINTYYPGSGLLYTVTGSDNKVYATCTQYEPTGKIGQINHANGTATRYTYDPATTRLMGVVTADPSGQPQNDIQRRAYTYTRAGDMLQVRDDLRNVNYNYTYDKFHRLKAETNTGPYAALSFTYNAIGNIMARTVGQTTATYAYDPLHKHAVKSITKNGQSYGYTYDEVGNMIAGPDFTDSAQIAYRNITYNANNMPILIEHTKAGTTVTTAFVYDGLGQRAKKQVSTGSTTYYIVAHFEVKDGVATKYIFAGNLRVAQVKGEVLNYFHKDHLNSSTATTDSTGAVVEESEYMPFGGMRDHTGQLVSDYKFTDQEHDQSTGLYNFKARLYDPEIARFISPDSTVPRLYDPQSLNRYTYCRNNPLVYVDPTGFATLYGGFVGGGNTGLGSGGSHASGIGVNTVTGKVTGYHSISNSNKGTISYSLGPEIGFDTGSSMEGRSRAGQLSILALTFTNYSREGKFTGFSIQYNFIPARFSPVISLQELETKTELTKPYQYNSALDAFHTSRHSAEEEDLALDIDNDGKIGWNDIDGFSWDTFWGSQVDAKETVQTTQTTETSPADALDNDQDGMFDSADPDTDGLDNDQDGLSDNADTDGEGVGDADGKVLCTELHRQGILPDDIYQADSQYARHLNPVVLQGYQLWARPLARYMSKSKLLTATLAPFIKAWADNMAYKMGIVEKQNLLGSALEYVGVPICRIVGEGISSILIYNLSFLMLFVISSYMIAHLFYIEKKRAKKR